MKIDTIMGYSCADDLLKACDEYLGGNVWVFDTHELGGLLTTIMKTGHFLKDKFLLAANARDWDVVLVMLIRDELRRD